MSKRYSWSPMVENGSITKISRGLQYPHASTKLALKRWAFTPYPVSRKLTNPESGRCQSRNDASTKTSRRLLLAKERYHHHRHTTRHRDAHAVHLPRPPSQHSRSHTRWVASTSITWPQIERRRSRLTNQLLDREVQQTASHTNNVQNEAARCSPDPRER
jgi:hypothetical protein